LDLIRAKVTPEKPARSRHPANWLECSLASTGPRRLCAPHQILRLNLNPYHPTPTKDHEFLLKGDVFTTGFLDLWIATKREERDALRRRPHPREFFLYCGV
jgi:hypothetical protein